MKAKLGGIYLVPWRRLLLGEKKPNTLMANIFMQGLFIFSDFITILRFLISADRHAQSRRGRIPISLPTANAGTFVKRK